MMRHLKFGGQGQYRSWLELAKSESLKAEVASMIDNCIRRRLFIKKSAVVSSLSKISTGWPNSAIPADDPEATGATENATFERPSLAIRLVQAVGG
jgi:hypothetical protein